MQRDPLDDLFDLVMQHDHMSGRESIELRRTTEIFS